MTRRQHIARIRELVNQLYSYKIIYLDGHSVAQENEALEAMASMARAIAEKATTVATTKE